jgi:uncharacterized membrane protein
MYKDMNNKKVGGVLIGLSIFLGLLIFSLISQLAVEQQANGCAPTTEECAGLDSQMSLSHIAVGILSATLALGVYLIFFSRGEEAVLKRLEQEKRKSLADERFSILMRAFDETEKNVLKVLQEEPGIEQNSLVLRTGLSKAKISQVLSDLEKKKLLERKVKGKKYTVWLSSEFLD